MKAKKQLGQHFLKDNYVVSRIIEAISHYCSNELPLVEIGPGQGVLTKSLQSAYRAFKAIELDRDMNEYLRLYLRPDQLIHADFLKVDLPSLFEGQSFNMVGNFPYNISSQIVFRLVDNRAYIPVMLGMFQKELAERICAVPGNKSNGILSLVAQAHYNAEILFDIGPEAFNPPPKVNSSVIVLTRKQELQPDCDMVLYRKVIKQAFQQRRKKMRNTLKSFNIDESDPIYQKRPEELGVSDFVNIVNSLKG